MASLTLAEQRMVDDAVRDLNAIYTAKALETACLIGEYVIERFFGGEIESFGNVGSENTSFRALAKHPGLSFSASYLWTAVAVVRQMGELPENLGRCLPLSHHRLLLPVTDSATKEALARKAVEGALSKRELTREIQEMRGRRGQREPKRAAGPSMVQALKELVDASEKFVLAATMVEGNLDRVEGQTVKSLLRRLELDIDAVRCVVTMMRSRRQGPTESVSRVSPGKLPPLSQGNPGDH